MQLAQLLGQHLGRRAHEQIVRLLVHREQRDLAQVLGPDQQHDDAVDAGRHAAVRRRAVLEGAVEAAETRLDLGLAEPSDLEGLHHRIGAVVTHRARRDLEAVADDIVLVRLDLEAVLVALCGFQRREAALGHRERVVREVDLLVLLVPLVEREVDDPGEREFALVDELQLRADARARFAGELVELVRVAGGEEHRVAIAKTKLRRDSVRSGPMFLAMGPAASLSRQKI